MIVANLFLGNIQEPYVVGLGSGSIRLDFGSETIKFFTPDDEGRIYGLRESIRDYMIEHNLVYETFNLYSRNPENNDAQYQIYIVLNVLFCEDRVYGNDVYGLLTTKHVMSCEYSLGGYWARFLLNVYREHSGGLKYTTYKVRLYFYDSEGEVATHETTYQYESSHEALSSVELNWQTIIGNVSASLKFEDVIKAEIVTNENWFSTERIYTLYPLREAYTSTFSYRNRYGMFERISIPGAVLVSPSEEYDTAIINGIDTKYDRQHKRTFTLTCDAVMPQLVPHIRELLKSRDVTYDGEAVNITEFEMDESNEQNSPVALSITFEYCDSRELIYL